MPGHRHRKHRSHGQCHRKQQHTPQPPTPSAHATATVTATASTAVKSLPGPSPGHSHCPSSSQRRCRVADPCHGHNDRNDWCWCCCHKQRKRHRHWHCKRYPQRYSVRVRARMLCTIHDAGLYAAVKWQVCTRARPCDVCDPKTLSLRVHLTGQATRDSGAFWSKCCTLPDLRRCSP